MTTEDGSRRADVGRLGCARCSVVASYVVLDAAGVHWERCCAGHLWQACEARGEGARVWTARESAGWVGPSPGFPTTPHDSRAGAPSYTPGENPDPLRDVVTCPRCDKDLVNWPKTGSPTALESHLRHCLTPERPTPLCSRLACDREAAARVQDGREERLVCEYHLAEMVVGGDWDGGLVVPLKAKAAQRGNPDAALESEASIRWRLEQAVRQSAPKAVDASKPHPLEGTPYLRTNSQFDTPVCFVSPSVAAVLKETEQAMQPAPKVLPPLCHGQMDPRDADAQWRCGACARTLSYEETLYWAQRGRRLEAHAETGHFQDVPMPRGEGQALESTVKSGVWGSA